MAKETQQWFCKHCRRLTTHEVDYREHPSHWTECNGVRVFERKRDCQECPTDANLSTVFTCELDFDDLADLQRELIQLREFRRRVESALHACESIGSPADSAIA